ncbi:MAG: ABC transporter ATP-binding protein [Clostridiales bacterium]|nr:ABC transporter ATP-binding protein [Clostridiales bacterium]
MQAYAEMSLPAYMSDLVDVGIAQHGFEHAAADRISAAGMEKLLLLMNEKQKDRIAAAYALQDDMYVLQPAGTAQREELDQSLELPMALLFTLQQQPGAVEGLLGAVASGQMTGELVLKNARDTLESKGFLSKSMLRQAALQFVKADYEEMGFDISFTQQSYMRLAGLKMIGFTLLMGSAAVVVGFISSRAAARIGRDLRRRTFGKVLSFSKAEMDKFSIASLITRSGNDIRQVEQSSTMVFRILLYSPILGAIGIWRVAQLKSGLSWIVILGVAAAALLIGVLAGMALPKFKIMQKRVDRQNLVSREILTGLSVIRAFNREQFEEDRFETANKDLIRVLRFVLRIFTIMMPAMMLVMNVVMLAIIWFGAQGINMGQLQVGEMMAMITYAMSIIMSFMMLSMVAVMLPRANVSAVRILEVLDTQSSIQDRLGAQEIAGKTKGELVFDHVSFRYPDAQEDTLHDITFTAKPGETTAIIGGTGSGKSTLVNLIPRLYDVTEGSIELDGTDVRKIRLRDLRRQMGYVPQQGVLFSGDIASNIKYSHEQVSDEAMKAAAGIAQAQEFIDEKEEGYESPISRGGSNVSGGQKQRLSIARAIASRPPIVLFDDSFSALDYRTDVQLRRALRQEMKDSTVIIVGQRIATVMHAQKIVVLDEGRLVGLGTHEQLMQNSPVYKAIAQSQLSEEELKGGVGL